ncbi:MAG: Lrp/AsnC family transcriptional regulator [Angelakisella sp.]
MENKILDILASNARLSTEQIAAMTGLTPVEVASEIDRMQAAGIIRGYKAIVDWDKTNRSVCSARIEIRVTPKSGMGFEEIL